MSNKITDDIAKVRIDLDADKAAKQIKQLEGYAQHLRQELDNVGTGDPTKRGALKKTLQETQDQMQKLRESARQSVNVIINGESAGRTLRELEAASRTLKRQLKDVADPEVFKAGAQKLQEIDKQIGAMNKTLSGTSGIWGGITAQVKQFGLLAAGYLGFQAISSQVSNIINKNAQLSDSLANVQATTGLTAKEVEELNKQLGKIDTRTSKQDLLEIAKVAGQFGVAKNEIFDFTKAVNEASVVLSSEFKGGAEEITTTLAQLRNVLHDVKTEKIDEDITHLGNALIKLAQEGVATGPVVADFAQRIGGVGSQLGLTSAQIFGLSATMQELAISTERGGTAVSKILLKMTQNTEQFAKVAGVPLKEFQHQVETDIYGAFLKFVEGSKKGGDSAIAFSNILKDSEISGAGASEVIAKLSANMPTLADRVKLAGDALQSTSAITEQYAIKNENFAAQLEKLSKNIYKAFTNSSVNAFFTGIVSGLNEMFDATSKADKAAKEFASSKKTFEDYEKVIPPLTSRYEELKSKTTLTKDEQTELKNIISKIAEYIPTAITQFDEFGKALDIDAAKAKNFGDNLRAMMEIKNAAALRENRAALYDLRSEIEATQKALNTRDDQGFLVRTDVSIKKVGEDFERVTKTVRLTDKQIQDLQQKLAEQQTKKTGFEGLINELSGVKLYADQAAASVAKVKGSDPEKPTAASTPGIDPDAQKKFEDYKNKIKQLFDDLQNIKTAAIREDAERDGLALSNKYQQEQEKAQANLAEIEKTFGKESAQAIEYKKYTNQYLIELETKYRQDQLTLTEKSIKALSEAEFVQDTKNLAQWHATRKLAITQDYNDQKITKEQFEDEIKKLEEETLRYKLGIAKDYGMSTTEIEQQIADGKKSIWEKNIKEIEQLDADSMNRRADQLSDFYSHLEKLISASDNLKKVKEDNELKRDKKLNDEKKKNLKKRFDSGELDKAHYEAEIAQIDEKYDRKAAALKKKQWQRQKEADSKTAFIQGIVSVVKTLAQYPYPYNLALAALDAVAVGIQLEAINSESPPEFARGKREGFIPKGPTHAQGGIKLVAGNKIIGEMEGDEAIIPAETSRRNAATINTLLNGGNVHPDYGDARNLTSFTVFENGKYPSFITPSTKSLNVQPVIDNIQAQKFGYSLPTFGGNTSTTTNEEILKILKKHDESLERLNRNLENPKPAPAYLNYNRFKEDLALVEQAKANSRVG